MTSNTIPAAGLHIPGGTKTPDDVKQKVDQYNQQIAKQEDKTENDWSVLNQFAFDAQIAAYLNDGKPNNIKEAARQARLEGNYKEAAALDQLDEDNSELIKMSENAHRDVIKTWTADLEAQGVKVPADLGSGDEALQKLASLQYTVDLQKVGADAAGDYTGSITAQIMLANIGRTQLLDNQLSDQLKDLQDKNKLLAEANKVMSDLRAARPADSDDDAKVPSGVVQWARDNGVSIPGDVAAGKSVKQAVWDQFIQNIKSFVDTNNNDSQLMMVRLQDIQQKRDNAFELVSNLIKKLGQVDEQIIQGMG